MTLFVFTWCIIGMSFAMYQIYFLKNTTPPIMDILVKEMLREIEKSSQYGDLPSEKTIETLITIGITLVWVIAWPILVFK